MTFAIYFEEILRRVLHSPRAPNASNHFCHSPKTAYDRYAIPSRMGFDDCSFSAQRSTNPLIQIENVNKIEAFEKKREGKSKNIASFERCERNPNMKSTHCPHCKQVLWLLINKPSLFASFATALSPTVCLSSQMWSLSLCFPTKYGLIEMSGMQRDSCYGWPVACGSD